MTETIEIKKYITTTGIFGGLTRKKLLDLYDENSEIYIEDIDVTLYSFTIYRLEDVFQANGHFLNAELAPSDQHDLLDNLAVIASGLILEHLDPELTSFALPTDLMWDDPTFKVSLNLKPADILAFANDVKSGKIRGKYEIEFLFNDDPTN